MCVCACVRVDRKRLTRLENMHIYTSPIFIVAVYMWYQVCIKIYIYMCVCVCVRACALTVKG